jgi:hypothetical protein
MEQIWSESPYQTQLNTAQHGEIGLNMNLLTCGFYLPAAHANCGTYLGVKGSQVQILSSRQVANRPADLVKTQVSGPFFLPQTINC